MLEEYAAILVQKFLGNYVRGINKEALKISAWQGDVELKNMQLRPEALNALKLPVKVKAGFLGSVRLKVPWTKLGNEPVVVYLDRIFVLAEPALQVEGSSEEALQEAKRNYVKEMEMKLIEARDELKPEMNTSWLSSVINTIVGNLKLSISNIHIRYEDTESNPGHPFAAGLTLGKLSAVTVDDQGNETFATGVNLDRIRKSVELESLAFYFDSDSNPWEVDKRWEDMLPSEWSQIFEFGEKDDGTSEKASFKHSYILQPVTGTAKYTKLRLLEARRTNQALQNAVVDLADVTLSLSKDGYRDIMMMADNFSAFNQRLKYAHYRPSLPVKSDPKSWWKYAYRVVIEETKKASGRLAWDQVLKYSKLRKKYVSLYASLLKEDSSRNDDEEIKKLDRQLDPEVILQWRMLAHKFVEESTKREIISSKQKAKQSWWPFGSGSAKEEPTFKGLTDEDWEKLNKIIGYKNENSEEFLLSIQDKNLMQFSVKVRMKHNASRLTHGDECLADLSCDELLCKLQMYPETKIFDLKLGSYKLSSPYGLLAESATVSDSFGGVFCYKPFEEPIDWSFTAKAKPCYVTYLKESIDLIVNFFKSSPTISQILAMEAAAAVQMTIDEVKRTAQQQVTRALKDKARFSLDLDIAAPKITIPSKFCPDGIHETKLLLDLGNLILRTQEMWDYDSAEGEEDLYLQFNLDLSDVSAFLVDGEYQWSLLPAGSGSNQSGSNMLLPVIDKCGIVVKLQQIQLENPCYPSTRLAVRLPSLGFHFSPARYHRLMAVTKIFQGDNTGIDQSILQLQDQANLKGWLSVLSWKGVGNREPVWQRRYLRLVGPFLYIFESPTSPVYKRWISLRGKQVHRVNSGLAGGVENILALYNSGQLNPKVLEDANALILLSESDEARRTWHKHLQGAIYRASGASSVATVSEVPSPDGSTRANSFKSDNMLNDAIIEKLFLSGVLDELRVCFSCSYENNQDFKTILLSKEKSLFTLRAVGGQVELSMKAGNILIGTILRSLEIEDQYSSSGASTSLPRYLARSFINSSDDTSVHNTSPVSSASLQRARSGNSLRKTESDENFFEVAGDFDEVYETPHPDQHQTSSEEFSLKPPGFSRIPGLIPNSESEPGEEKAEKNKERDSSDSFIKAQIVVYDQSSPEYKNLDNRVIITLAKLSFFCYRPTIIAIMEFANAINYVEAKENGSVNDIGSDNFSGPITRESEVEEESSSTAVLDPALRGLLGKGKSRVIFHLTLNMAKAAIYLMNETGSYVATLSQNNLLTDIKVFPSSFSIKASLGNLKISDDSLEKTHPYYWVCDMRNPEGTSFVEIDFTSFSVDDEDYCGYDYSLTGELSEVRIVYLNRFVQEIVGYFMGLIPRNADSVVKLKDNVTDSEKWVSKTDIEGSPAIKLDLSLSRPIILMPRSTNSLDFLELDVVTITVENTFQWLGGDKNDINAVHLDIMTIKVKDINLRIGIEMVHGESIIQDVHGLSVEIRRTLRDLSHLMPAVEAAIKMEVLKASLSNREYEIITECASSNFSETPNIVPSLHDQSPTTASTAAVASPSLVLPEALVQGRPHQDDEVVPWITTKCSVAVNLIELSLHSGFSRDSPLATLQATGAWLLYKSNTLEQGFLFATLKGFSVLDDREGTREEFRLVIGRSMNVSTSSSYESESYSEPTPTPVSQEKSFQQQLGFKPIPSMLILDTTFERDSTIVSLCIQRPKFLVALDFLVAIIEFFVPSFGAVLSKEDDNDLPLVVPAIIFVDQIYTQDCSVLSISPQKPLIADDERFAHFIYDGKGGKLLLQDRNGELLSGPSPETFIFVGSGKRLQFRNVTIVDGEYLDSCISLGSNSSYSASEADGVYLDRVEKDIEFGADIDKSGVTVQHSSATSAPTETIVQLQAIGPELTFYSSSKNISEQSALSTKVIHANTDAFCRIVMKGDSMEMSGDILGLKMESNGIRVLEPFDTSIKYSSASGRTSINLGFSEIYMNFSFSILRLILAVQDDILSFMQTSSKKATELCSQFDNVATIHGHGNDRIYAFWRPCAPSGFAVLGDCLTPLNEPPTKGVVALNTSLVRVKRPVAYKLVWQEVGENDGCSIWFPVAPKGYVAVGCVASTGSSEPPLSSALCVLATYVSSSALKDCIVLKTSRSASTMAFWRVDNCFGSFILEDPENLHLVGKAYDLRHMLFRNSSDPSSNASSGSHDQTSQRYSNRAQIEGDASFSSGRLLEVVESPKLVWWNNGTSSRKRLSIWRPDIPSGMVFFGDIAVKGYEQPNSAIVLRDTGDETLLRPPVSFQLVGRIKKQRGTDGISFWSPQPPPGFTSLGCIASKTVPKLEDFPSLRCIRSEMLTSGSFPEESIWDSSDARVSEPFSLWSVEGDSLGTFVVRNGFRKPQRRLAHKLLGPPESDRSNNLVFEAELKSFSAVAFDDYGGLMMPLFGVSLDNIGFSLHGGPDYLNANANFSLDVRSFNDKNDAWEPLIEPTDGFLRYQYDMSTPGTPTQLRMTSTRDLSLNISVSNVNMIFQAYSSWYNLCRVDETCKQTEAVSPANGERRVLDVHHRKNYYIVPQNFLGQDIYIRGTELKGFPRIIKLPSGDSQPVRVPIPKNSMHSHPKRNHHEVSRSMVTVIIAEAEIEVPKGLSTSEYVAAVQLYSSRASETPIQKQTARTCAALAEHSAEGLARVNWNEMFFFRVFESDDCTLEFAVTDLGRGETVGSFSSPLKDLVFDLSTVDSPGTSFEISWRDLVSTKLPGNCNSLTVEIHGRIKFAVLRSGRPKTQQQLNKPRHGISTRSGLIQISPSKDGPWTTVKLNYATPAMCWRFGNDVIASEMTVRDSDRYFTVRSLVSVTNDTDFVVEVRLKGKMIECGGLGIDEVRSESDEFVESQKYLPSSGWTDDQHQGQQSVELPSGWEWTDDWHLEAESGRAADGWIYTDDKKSRRQRKWIRHRRFSPLDSDQYISIGEVKPGATVPLPLLSSTNLSYSLEIRPTSTEDTTNYSWSIVKEGCENESDEICVSNLAESDKLLFCAPRDGSPSSSDGSNCVWFCASIDAKEIGKDVHSDPIHDWNIVVKPPLSLAYYLPYSSQYTVAVGNEPSGENGICSNGTIAPGSTVKIHNAGPNDPLYLSLLPQGGWELMHEPVIISHPTRAPSKLINLINAFSQRIVQITLEHNYDKDCPVSKVIRIYVPYWISCARLPPLSLCVMDISGKERTRFPRMSQSAKRTEKILWKITPDEMVDGYTIASVLGFKGLGMSASIPTQGKESFGPVKELTPLSDMDGSIDLLARDVNGNCTKILVSSKPSSFQAVPTKAILLRPFMTFINMVGQDVFVKLNDGEQPHTLLASDWKVSFPYCEDGHGPEKLQIRLGNTNWSHPVQISKEDSIVIVMRKADGGREFLRCEVRAYEEGSRFLIVFRLGPAEGPIRIENRTRGKIIQVQQSCLAEEAWIYLEPRTTKKFSLDDPYGRKVLEVAVRSGENISIHSVNLEKPSESVVELREKHGIELRIMDVGDIKVVTFMDERKEVQMEKCDASIAVQKEFRSTTMQLEVIVELGVVGVSLIDHRPKELLYLHLQRVFISYLSGTISRFKVLIGHLQLDNELPLTVMPVLLAPEEAPDPNHPVFKSNIAISNEMTDGTEVYPFVYLRVTRSLWRLNVHEPIIWALVDFYRNLRLDTMPSSTSVTQVDPEIRIEVINISEVRLKISLETAPTQRPRGALGIWSPIFSAVGAFKIQVHLRKVEQENKYMKKSHVLTAITNRIKRDLVHNPLHLIFSLDVMSMTKSALASLSKGFAELSTDVQFVQLRSKQVSSRKITGVGDGLVQGTEAFAQGVAFGVSGVLTKPAESVRQYGLLGLAHGMGRAFIGVIVQPLSGLLDFGSLTVNGIEASFIRCLEILNNKSVAQRIRNPRAIRADGVVREYSQWEASGQMVLYLAEASRHLACTDLFREPSKYAWSDYYEDHFIVPSQRIVLVTNKRVMLLQCQDLEKMDKKPSKILWDVPWEEVLALELAKRGHPKPSMLIIHLKTCTKSANFSRYIRCRVEEEDNNEPQAVVICSTIRRLWKAYQANKRVVLLRVPSSRRHVQFVADDFDGRESNGISRPMIKLKRSPSPDDHRFVKHTVNFHKIWSSEREIHSRCKLFKKQVADVSTICSIWRPLCHNGYVSVGDIVHVGTHAPNVAAVYLNSGDNFALPVGYDLVWRNCAEDYNAPVAIWLPRAPEGYLAIGCVAVADYEEPALDSVYCVSARLAEETSFVEQPVWSAPDSFPWSCYLYQVQSEALQFIALRLRKEEVDWRPMRVSDQLSSSTNV